MSTTQLSILHQDFVGDGLTKTANGKEVTVLAADDSIVVNENGVAVNTESLQLLAPQIVHNQTDQTMTYDMATNDDHVMFLITVASNCVLPPSADVLPGVNYTIKNKAASTHNVSVLTTTPDTGDNSLFTHTTPFVLVPGAAITVTWDESEWVILSQYTPAG